MAEPSKIRIKMGDIEVEYEGPESFLRDELPALLSAVSKLYHDSGGSTGARSNKGKNGGSKRPLEATTATIAGKLGCKVGNGRVLITAAAARYTFVLNKESFTRTDLLNEAKSATSYYKTTISNNLSTTLSALVRSEEFTEVSGGTYALSATKREELEKLLAS